MYTCICSHEFVNKLPLDENYKEVGKKYITISVTLYRERGKRDREIYVMHKGHR